MTSARDSQALPKGPNTLKFRYSISNPLPETLRHYERQLVECLNEGGGQLVRAKPATSIEVKGEPLLKLQRAISTALEHLRALRHDGHTIVLWPAFGLMEPAFWRHDEKSPGRHIVIIHDPSPLRKQHGLGRFAAQIGRLRRTGVQVVVHTELARQVLVDLAWREISVLPHPITVTKNEGSAKLTGCRSSDQILILGQWKPARNMQLIASLGPLLRRSGLRPTIAGPGWPQIEGWEVENRFLSEQEVAWRLETALCLLVPYSVYFQSNVAVRALESGTPVVGQRHEFLESLLGSDYSAFVKRGSDLLDWISAIEAAATLPSETLKEARLAYQTTAINLWSTFLSGEPEHSPPSVRP